MVTTATVQIGNTDNSLTQNEWSQFIYDMHERIAEHCTHIHFKGGSEYDAPWQNACWVVLVCSSAIDPLREAVIECRKCYRQKSAAITFGNTEMI